MKLESSMKTTPILLLAILASFTATGQAANVPINYLPFTISAPGTYVLSKDLTSTNVNAVAITMNQQAVGDIVLNLNGHTLHGNGAVAGVVFLFNGGAGALVLENGTVDGFTYGSETSNSPFTTNSHLLIENVTFKSTGPDSIGIELERVNGALISGCKFVGVMSWGVFDLNSMSRNTYSNLSFDGQQSINIQEGGTYPQTLSFQ
jgi:hypothetical protein